jgi:hypothetical protein
MQYEYGGWNIDATPDFSLGKFFARARLTRGSPDSEEDSEMHVGRDLAWFDSEDEAVQFAHQWAIAWIDKSCTGNTTTDDEVRTSTKGLRAETTAE